jgi:hypothetical protein
MPLFYYKVKSKGIKIKVRVNKKFLGLILFALVPLFKKGQGIN